jgi:hypothetical protein
MDKKYDNTVADLKILQATQKKLKTEQIDFQQASYNVLDIINSNLKSATFIEEIIHTDKLFNDKANDILKLISFRNKDIQKTL